MPFSAHAQKENIHSAGFFALQPAVRAVDQMPDRADEGELVHEGVGLFGNIGAAGKSVKPTIKKTAAKEIVFNNIFNLPALGFCFLGSSGSDSASGAMVSFFISAMIKLP